MAHAPKPFFRTARNAWYVQVAGRQSKLCDGPKCPATEKAAWAAFHALMAAQRPAAPGFSASSAAAPVGPPNDAGPTVAEVYEKYLDWCQKHRSPRTYQWSLGHIQSFCDHLTAARALPAAALRPFNVQEWVDGKATWGANQRRGAVVAVTRPFNWAARQGYITASPVRGVEKPPAEKRDSSLTAADFSRLLGFVKDAAFRDLLVFAYEAGVRPQEARQVEARHYRHEAHRVEIPPAEAKGKRRWRVIYLSPAAEAVLARLAADRPSGKLFLNTDGRPWTAQAVVCRFQRLLVKMAGAEAVLPPLPRFDRRKFADPAERAAAKAAHEEARAKRRRERAKLAREGEKRYAMYDLRHLFATRKLKEGADPVTVAALLGHKDAGMLFKHYEQLSTDGEHLRRAVGGA